MADTPVQIDRNVDEVQGQPQVKLPDPHDGHVAVDEVRVHTDKVILDPNSELAVQVPEGVGASTYGHRSPLGEALEVGTAQEQFDRENASEPTEPSAESDQTS